VSQKTGESGVHVLVKLPDNGDIAVESRNIRPKFDAILSFERQFREDT